MPGADDNIEHEPALGGGDGRPAGESVFDEPSIVGTHGTQEEPGSALGEEPALAGVSSALPSYQRVYQDLRATTPPSEQWATATAVGLVSLAAGLVVLAFSWLSFPFFTIPSTTTAAVFGPVVFAVVKATVGLVWVERRPWTVPNAGSVVAAVAAPDVVVGAFLLGGAVSGAVPFASTTALPLALTGFLVPGLIAGLGVARVWEAVDTGTRRPDTGLAIPWLAVAAGLAAVAQVVVLVIS
ncbi:MAG: hypothetical protein OEO77_10005 [Acidimicrobiia bacterium]|nr:hypothetical protein [Acidimicrobiia bacterium]